MSGMSDASVEPSTLNIEAFPNTDGLLLKAERIHETVEMIASQSMTYS